MLLPMSAPAHAATRDTVSRPTSGGFVISGQGFGHGRGMSQWGAYGAATAGLNWSRILDFYYPGTVRSKLPESTMRVWLSADNDGDTRIAPARGMSLTVGATRKALPSGNGYRAWRAVRSGKTLNVQYLNNANTWRPYTTTTGSAVIFATKSGLVDVLLPGGNVKRVRGSVSAVSDRAATSGMRTVLNSSMESYLRSVVPNEMPASWHPNALAAQTVAARTYAAAYRTNQRARKATWDICDSTTCQVFKGVANTSRRGTRTPGEYASTDAAIKATTGTVLRTRNKNFAFAEFSASNGGWTAEGGPYYQVAKPDPYDGRMKNPNSSWSVTISPAKMDAAFGVGTVRSLRITQRDGHGARGGRVLSVLVSGSRGTKTVSGDSFRWALRLRSDWVSFAG